MRGYVVRPIYDGRWDAGLPVFRARRFPIVGVVFRKETGEEGDVAPGQLMTVILNPCLAGAEDGGIGVYVPDDHDDPAFSVVWCDWPPDEDEKRFLDINAFVEAEARATLRRQSREAHEKRKQTDPAPKLAVTDLQAACYEVARSTGWNPSDALAGSLDAMTPMVRRYVAIAKTHEARLAEEGVDPTALIRAVRYLAHAHAMPPMGEDERWFADMLEVLMGLIAPDSAPTDAAREFITDLRQAIDRQIRN